MHSGRRAQLHTCDAPLQRIFARVVRKLDEENHGHEDQRGHEARGGRSPPTPIETDLFLFPVPDHGLSLIALTIWGKRKVPGKSSTYTVSCTARRSEHAEDLVDLFLVVERT